MKVKFIEYDGIKGYSKVMYNDVKDADKYKIEVAYNGKDIKALLEYLFELEQKIDDVRNYIKWHYDLGTKENVEFCLLRDRLLEILGDKE